jgi:hypothetical protein
MPHYNNETNTITLTADPRGNYVTWTGGKKQIRFALKHAGYKVVDNFRSRKENKNEFSIMVHKDGIAYRATAARKPGAPLIFTPNPLTY